AAPTTPTAASPTGSRPGNRTAHHARPARSAGRGNRSGAASTPAGTGSCSTRIARSRTGGEYATVTAATRRRGHRSAFGNDTHNGSRTTPPAEITTCAQVTNPPPSPTPPPPTHPPPTSPPLTPHHP